MVDPIGIKAGTVADRRPAPVASAEPVAEVPSTPAVDSEPAVVASSTQLSGAMAARPPVDSERVARIRRAVREGRFPIYPTSIADRLLALKLDWNPNDKA